MYLSVEVGPGVGQVVRVINIFAVGFMFFVDIGRLYLYYRAVSAKEPG